MATAELTRQIANFRGTLLSLTRKFTSDKDQRRDLVQDTMLKALIHCDKFREGTNLKGWLFTIMRNTYINDYHRTKNARKATERDTDVRYIYAEDEHTFNLPQQRMEFDEIWHNVNTIREEFLIPFKMYTSGYRYQEIASYLDIPVGTVKNRIFQARKEIQKNLKGYK